MGKQWFWTIFLWSCPSRGLAAPHRAFRLQQNHPCCRYWADSAPVGHTVSGLDPSRTAFLFQENRFPVGTVLSICRRAPRQRREANAWLAFVELEGEGDRFPSAPVRRHGPAVGSGQCIALGGDYLLLDDTGVDQDRRGRLLSRLRALGTPVILASHEPDVLSACNQVYAFQGPPFRLKGEG